jgi:membrane protease YdiL (CAAX protease family)
MAVSTLVRIGCVLIVSIAASWFQSVGPRSRRQSHLKRQVTLMLDTDARMATANKVEATPVRAAALTLFFIFVFGPLAILLLEKTGLQSFDVARSQFVGLPTWYLVTAIVIVAAGEEWLYRGYAIERLEAAIGNAWIAGGISVALFALAHLPLWGFGVALTTLVSGSIFTVLYIRYRDVLFLILAHVLTDLYGLVITPINRS